MDDTGIFMDIASGKHTKYKIKTLNGKTHPFNWAMFNNYVTNYQRVIGEKKPMLFEFVQHTSCCFFHVNHMGLTQTCGTHGPTKSTTGWAIHLKNLADGENHPGTEEIFEVINHDLSKYETCNVFPVAAPKKVPYQLLSHKDIFWIILISYPAHPSGSHGSLRSELSIWKAGRST